MTDEPHHDGETPDEPPPLGTWPRMYALVLGSLGLWIVLFYLFSRTFS
jgi:hypothetical protein